ncbi:unnamed protein product [Discula destructiva]
MKPSMGPVTKLAMYVFAGSACYLIWDHVIDIPIRKIDLRTMPKGLEEEAPEPLFFPFPFTDKQVMPLPYAGDEEEWQNFIKFNKDQKLKERVKNDLNMLVKRAAEKNATTRRWAKNGESFNVGPTWLIMSFPERPPPEFVRKGLELGADGGIEIKTKKIDPRTKALIDRVLMPYPIASATYAFFKAMTVQNVSSVAKYFGLSPAGREINTSNPDPEIEKTLKKLQARQTAGGNTASGSPTSTSGRSTPSPASEPATSDTPEAPPPKNTNPNFTGRSDASQPNAAERPLARSIPYYSTLAGSSGPWAAFKETYKRTWKPLKSLPPRGSLAVHGLVALESPKGRVYIDVFAWYHPKTDQFHSESLTMNLRSITPFNQKPRR